MRLSHPEDRAALLYGHPERSEAELKDLLRERTRFFAGTRNDKKVKILNKARHGKLELLPPVML